MRGVLVKYLRPIANRHSQSFSYSLLSVQGQSKICFIDFFQVRRGSLLSQPHSVLQKLASISEGNPLAPRNSRGFLFQTLSPEKDKPTSNAPQKQVSEKTVTKQRCRVLVFVQVEKEKELDCVPVKLFSPAFHLH